MSAGSHKARRLDVARRSVTRGAMVAEATASGGRAAILTPVADDTADWVSKAAGKGDGEGKGAAPLVPDTRSLRAPGFMAGPLRPGLALCDAGDLVVAKTHMGHPTKEKHAALADTMRAEGYQNLKAEVAALAEGGSAIPRGARF